ncbi:hypothetical protein C8R31_101631 [Nitrosospira sp. Nsp2]|uniref:hypothetical protein n=1 Tax=Nitrosospira sp. Nsp2 TaxID=136548 RepID=UPI000D31E729|nr:hypothetical protein [Nitrosospira sp. Nsp2]PTR17467.1 hypothetical protein C8R31_101631 [Nitrosospira sp. Nsp2]
MTIPRNPKLIDPNDSGTGIAIIGIVALFAVLSWMDARDNPDAKLISCPRPGPGQQLIGRGHMEVDGERGELQCTYSTAPVYGSGVTVASTRL